MIAHLDIACAYWLSVQDSPAYSFQVSHWARPPSRPTATPFNPNPPWCTPARRRCCRPSALSWDTRLASVLPFFKLRDANASQEATVRDILSQSIGLPHNAYDNLLSSGVSYQELERKLATVPMTCDPGSCYGYQNIAFSLIGDVIHAKTGQFFIQLVDRYLFLPLGMTTASYGRDGLEGSHSWARPHYKRGK